MSNLQNKFLARMFRRIEGVVWDLTSNKMGLQTDQGIVTLEVTQTPNAESLASAHPVFNISVNPFDSFGFAMPAFAQNTPLNQIEIGDLIIGDRGVLGWVVEKFERSLRLLDQNGMTKNYTPPKIQVLNQDGAMVVKSLTGLFGEQGAQGFSGALLPLLLAGDAFGGVGNLDELLPIMLMTQMTQGSNNPNALAGALPTILMMKSLKGGNGRMSDLMLPMLLSGGLNGGGMGGMNPMMLMAFLGENEGGGLGSVPAQLIGQKAPALRPTSVYAPSAVPPLQRTR